jgi:Trk-type K+ transport system membrane component
VARAQREYRTGFRKDKQMFRTENREKVKQLKPKTKTIAFTILWFALAAAALLFIAFAAHI